MPRETYAGDLRIDTGIDLREDFYAVAYLYQFKPEFIFGETPQEFKMNQLVT